MHRIAIFVEGQTEQIFIERLIKEIAGNIGIVFDRRKATGGSSYPRRMISLKTISKNLKDGFYVLIVDSTGEQSVASDINDQYNSLISKNYKAIVGIRDVYPNFSFQEITQLRTRLSSHQEIIPFPPQFVLAIMEIEAWFLAEYSHFEKLDSRLTIEKIKTEMGFDPRADDMMQRPHPAEDLKNIYGLCCKTYNKSKSTVETVVSLLDYARIYLELGEKFSDLKELFKTIDSFLDGFPNSQTTTN